MKPVLVLVGSAFSTEVLIALGGVQCGAQLLLPQGLHTPDLISEKQHVMVLLGLIGRKFGGHNVFIWRIKIFIYLKAVR